MEDGILEDLQGRGSFFSPISRSISCVPHGLDFDGLAAIPIAGQNIFRLTARGHSAHAAETLSERMPRTAAVVCSKIFHESPGAAGRLRAR